MIGINALVFVSIESARLAFSNESWHMDYSLPRGAECSSPGIGDGAQMIARNFTGGFDDRMMLFRKANVVVAGVRRIPEALRSDTIGSLI